MTITFIHIIEAITLLLIIVKSLQIRKLYRQSRLNHLQAKQSYFYKSRSPSSSMIKQARAKNTSNKKPSIYNRFTANYSQHNLPLPDVSFSEGLPLPEVTFSSNDETHYASNERPQTKHKKILNNYIEECFFESTPDMFQDAEVVEFKQYKIDSSAEDEFITVVDDEHDEFLRAFETLEKSVCIAR